MDLHLYRNVHLSWKVWCVYCFVGFKQFIDMHVFIMIVCMLIVLYGQSKCCPHAYIDMCSFYYITWPLGRHTCPTWWKNLVSCMCAVSLICNLSNMVGQICQHAFIRYGLIHCLSYMVGQLCWQTSYMVEYMFGYVLFVLYGFYMYM